MTEQNATVLHVPAGVGIDQSVREEHVPPGTANIYQENVRVTAQGSLVKRPDFTALSTARLGPGSPPAISSGLRVAPFKDSIVMTDGAVLNSYVAAQGKWSPCGRLPECSISTKAVAGSYATFLDIAYGDTVYAVISNELSSLVSGGFSTNSITVRVIDQATKRQVATYVLDPTTATIPNIVRCVISGTKLAVFWNNARASLNISGAVLDLSTLTSFGGIVTIASDVNGPFDVMVLPAGTIALAYGNNSASTARITILELSASTLATVNSTTETTSSDLIQSICLAGSEELWTVWSYGSTNKKVWGSLRNSTTITSSIASATQLLDFTGGSTVTPVRVTAARTAASTVYVAASGTDTVDATSKYSKVGKFANVSSAITPSLAMTYIGGWVPSSQPFASAGRVFMEFVYDDLVDFNVVVGDITSDATTSGFDHNQTIRPVAQVAPRLNSWPVTAATSAKHVPQVGQVFATAHIIQGEDNSAAINITEMDFGSQVRQLPLSFAGQLYWSGGMLYQFDGERCFEQSFVSPPGLQCFDGGAGSLSGTYLYTAIDEFTDAAGNVTWGPPSPVRTMVVTNRQVSAVVRRPSMTWKDGYDPATYLQPQGGRTTITKLFRTVNGGGVFYFQVGYYSRQLDGLQTFTDNESDASLQASAQLYTDPGTVGTAKARQSMGGCLQMVECNGVMVAAMPDGLTLRCTAQRVVGESPWHNDVLQLPIEGDGAFTGLASMDGSVIVFRRDSIYVVPVESANDNVTAGGFGEPKRIACDAGCIDPRSIVVTGEGTVFQSDRGIELLTRQLDVVFAGKKIQLTFASFPNVVASVLDIRNGLVRLSLAQTGSNTVGIDAVYDTVFQLWSSFDTKKSSAGQANRQAVSAAYCKGSSGYVYTWLDAGGVVYQESLGSSLAADGSFVPSTWITPRIKTELQREHQMWQGDILFARNESAGLTATIAYDWAGFTDTRTWLESDITANPSQTELRVTGRHQAIKIQFTDTAPASPVTGKGLEFIGFSLDLAPHQGPTQGTPKLAVGARK